MRQTICGDYVRACSLWFRCLSLVTIALGLGVVDERAVAKESPNIVVIMADDMGYSDLGCFGGEILTPHLDQLAAGGLRFTNFYSENMCWVSRAALLTGIGHKTSMVNSTIHPRCVTLPEVLRQQNYQTRMSGKWHLAGKGSTVYPNDRGFDEFYGILGGAASFFAPFSLSRNRVNVEQEATDDPDYYFTDAISSEAVRMVQTADPKKPLFLYVAYTAAHWPLHAREADIKAYQGKYAMGWDKMRQQRLVRMKSLGILPQDLQLSPRNAKVPPWNATDNQAWQQRRMEVYAAQVTAMDRGIGRLVDSLEKTGRLENTVVFFTIDNGGCHVEYGTNRKGTYLPEKTRDGRPVRPGNLPSIMPGPEDTYQSYGYGWANASNTPYRMFKQYDHEGGIRTPMIAHWPRGIKKRGSLVQGVSHLIDILPTVIEVTGGKVASRRQGKPTIERDGQSLAAAFRDEALAETRTLFFAHNKGRALRQGNWKLVSRDRKPWELYDLSQDPLELRDLSKQETERRDLLIRQWRDESRRHSEQAKLK